MNKPIRHGEVVLLPVGNKIPKTANHTKTHIVGHSETGHHHVLEAADVIHWTDKETNELFVAIKEPGKLVHKKTTNRHIDLDVTPGTYKVIRKSEYDPFLKAMREVWD